jgi:hypothetical protein
VAAGRATSAHIDVAEAARQAARAASLARDPATAERAARQTAAAALASDRITCTDVDFAVDTTRLRPGGSVTVRVSCTRRLTGLALPAATRTSASFTSPVDAYRGDPP